jgi:hypothetical protein
LRPGENNESSWLRCDCYFIASLFGALLVSLLLIVLVDPFDRGHGLSLMPPGVLDESPRTANVSRGRDPRFDAAIFGNSHIQLIDPHRLSAATGLNFVQMSTPGTGPREQAALMTWFLRNHANTKAMVLGIDERWCLGDPGMPLTNPFPFWLYGSDFEYVLNVVSTHSLALAWRRIKIAAGRSPVTDPLGYWNYEDGRVWNFRPAAEERAPVDLSPAAGVGMKFPALDHIEAVLARLPAGTQVLLIMPPQFVANLPAATSAAGRELAACKHDLMLRASERNWRFIDYLLDTPLSRNSENFWDTEHFRMNVAQAIERRIAEEAHRTRALER